MAFSFSNILARFKEILSGGNKDGIVGIDVGSSSIKVVELHSNKGVPTLDTYGELQLGPYADIEIGMTTNLEVATLAQALIDIIRESSVGTKKAALSISYNASFVTVVMVPHESQQDLSEKVTAEARKHIPVPINTVSLDWFSLGQSKDGSASRVLIAAIHNDSLKKYQSTVTGAGLSTLLTEIEVFSTIRTAVSRKDNTVAIVDLGASGSRLYIAEKGTLIRSHSTRLGGVELTKLLSSTRKLEFVEAEKHKRNGLENDNEGKRVVHNALERGLKEIAQVLRQYEESEGQAVDKVVLSGGGALLSGVGGLTEEVLKRPVELSDPFAKVAYPAFLEDVLTTTGPSFSIAIGAALQQLNNEQH